MKVLFLKRLMLGIAFALLLLGIASQPAIAAEATKPNIIFVLADDLGIDGVSCYGADKHQTPHIDALAASGLRFQTCYAAPLCGPSRCLLMTGRYAFRTGGITNGSWRAGGPGAKSPDEQPMAKLLKQAGYATCQAGKWRQVGELPGDWGFDEFLTDNTASGWYWQTRYNKNGKEINLPEGTYGPDVIEDFTFDFIRRHKEKPFFVYYAMHLVHSPILRTPDTVKGTTASDKLYDDNIRYMDKKLGSLVDELEKQGLRQNTLLIFSGDNGTAAGRPSPVHGRMINGWKGSMLEGGSRVPFIASWPAVTPKGKVSQDIVSFADPYATFNELAGVKPPEGFKTDGKSFLPQLRGESGMHRAWAYVQLDGHWYVREPGFKMNEAGSLFDMSDAPFVEQLVDPAADNFQSKAARARLAAVLADLNPAAGKTDKAPPGNAQRRQRRNAARGGQAASAVGPWKSGDVVPGENAPNLVGKALEISADVAATGAEGVIIAQGASARGYVVYLDQGKLAFAVRKSKDDLTTIVAKDPLGAGNFKVKATLSSDGAMTLSVDGKQVAEGKTNGLITLQPKRGLSIGTANDGKVGDEATTKTFAGKVTNASVKTTEAK